MKYEVVNRSRQGIPVIIRKDGKLVQVDLSYQGENSKVVSEELTMSIRSLERSKLIKINNKK